VSGEKTCIKSTGIIGFGECSSIAAVDVKDGKILRIRSFPIPPNTHLKNSGYGRWKRGEKVFEPPLKSMPVPMGHAYKKRVYSRTAPYP
jgi:hypothetical protein